jgi:3-deoxy-D-manno-octulosonic acid kinase
LETFLVNDPGVFAFALENALPWARSVLAQGTTLHAWARRQERAAAHAGRADVYEIDAAAVGPDGRDRWAVRHYARGGAAAPLLGDRYAALGTPRPLRELAASLEARGRGVPTPAVVAGAVYAARLFYRADLVSEWVPGGRDLARVLFGPNAEGTARAADALTAAGRLVRELEDARLVHADLNAMNVLVTGSGERAVAHALDLDRCRVLPRDAPVPVGPMRRRLARSLRKLERTRGPRLGAAEWAALHAALGGRP